jgi:hypothetical protein
MLFSTKRFTNNPIARAELAHLRRQHDNRWLQLIDRILLIPALGLAPIPFLTYINSTNLNLYLVMLIAIVSFCIWIEVRMVIVAVNSVWRQRRADTWESLILTGIDARQIVLGKWWAVVRQTWRSYVHLAALKLALACGIMQYLNIYPRWIDIEIDNINRAFYYMSYQNYAATVPLAWNPGITAFIIGALVATFFSLAEDILTVAVGMLVSLVVRRMNTIGMIVSAILRVVLGVVGIVLVFWIRDLEIRAWRERHNWQVYWGCDGEYFRKQTDYYNWCVEERVARRIFETLQVSASSLADNGLLLAANILRPIGSPLFVLRNVASAILGLGIYAILTWMCLRFAQFLAVRQGASPPEKRRAGH